MARVSRLFAVLGFAACVAWAGVANAQVGGYITGLITDEQGKPVDGVYVTAHGYEQSQLIKTSESGEFRLQNLVPGRYVLTVARDGFTTIVHSGIMVRAGKTAHLPAQGACLKGDAVVSVINQHVELPGRPRRRCFIGDRDMFGQIGFTAQTAVGGVLAFLMDFRGVSLRRPAQRKG